MNSWDLTLKDIGYIMALARLRSFSQAAEACSVSQPALSKQLKTIEATLGIQLFERTKRQVMLTEAGKLFVKQAQVVLDEAEKLLQVTCQERLPLSGGFKLGVIASSCPYLLPYFLGKLQATFTQLSLSIKEGLTESLIRDLKQGNLDAVIAATTFEDEALHCTPLFFEPFLLAANKITNARQKRFVATKDIDTERILLLEDGHCLKDQTLELCAMQDKNATFSIKATSLETLMQMTAGGLGVSVIPRLAAAPTSQLGSALMFSEFKDKRAGRVMALYYRKSYPLPNDIETLADFIRQYLPDTVRVLE
jgi:LysR family hydrogen peroxide-inducible transcriptional activator